MYVCFFVPKHILRLKPCLCQKDNNLDTHILDTIAGVLSEGHLPQTTATTDDSYHASSTAHKRNAALLAFTTYTGVTPGDASTPSAEQMLALRQMVAQGADTGALAAAVAQGAGTGALVTAVAMATEEAAPAPSTLTFGPQHPQEQTCAMYITYRYTNIMYVYSDIQMCGCMYVCMDAY